MEHGQRTAFNGLNALCNPMTKVPYEDTNVLNVVYHWKIMNVSHYVHDVTWLVPLHVVMARCT